MMKMTVMKTKTSTSFGDSAIVILWSADGWVLLFVFTIVSFYCSDDEDDDDSDEEEVKVQKSAVKPPKKVRPYKL